jgi:hypothetical protein
LPRKRGVEKVRVKGYVCTIVDIECLYAIDELAEWWRVHILPTAIEEHDVEIIE